MKTDGKHPEGKRFRRATFLTIAMLAPAGKGGRSCFAYPRESEVHAGASAITWKFG